MDPNQVEMQANSAPAGDTDKMVEILKNQLYFAVIKGLSGKKIKSTAEALYFSIDEEFVYNNYYFDFGPYNISYLYKYCCKLNKYLQYSKGQKRVVHCTSTNFEKKTNAAFLMGGFCIIYLKMHPDTVYKTLCKVGAFKPFLDASQCPCQFTLKLDTYFNAISKALAFNFVNFEDFDVTEYDMYDKLQFGDMNWLIPRKFLAFIGPNSNEYLNGHPPEFYLKYFLKNDVKTVVRLNNKMYDSQVFTSAGVAHFDLIYPDGSTPSKEILLKFLQIAETAPAAIAVHCKAGLGRTGSLIGAYIMKHYQMTAEETIAWLRMCRPGSVIGQQQLWLQKLEAWLWRMGSQFRMKHFGEGDKIPRHKYGIYSKLWPAERNKIIREAKRKYQSTNNVPYDRQQNSANVKGSVSQNETEHKPYRLRKKMTSRDKTNYQEIARILSGVKTQQSARDEPVSAQQQQRPASVCKRQRPCSNASNWGYDAGTAQLQGPPTRKSANAFIERRSNDVQGDNPYVEYMKAKPHSGKFSANDKLEIFSKKLKDEMSKKCPSKYVSQQLTQGDRLNELKAAKQKRCNSANPRAVAANRNIYNNPIYTVNPVQRLENESQDYYYSDY